VAARDTRQLYADMGICQGVESAFTPLDHVFNLSPLSPRSPKPGHSVTYVLRLKCYLCPWTVPACSLTRACADRPQGAATSVRTAPSVSALRSEGLCGRGPESLQLMRISLGSPDRTQSTRQLQSVYRSCVVVATDRGGMDWVGGRILM